MLNNTQVMAAFSRGEEANGANVRSVNVRGTLVFYSYSTPIAFRVTKRESNFPDIVYLDARKYSVTTSKQQNQLGHLFCGMRQTLPHDEFRAMLREHGISLAGAR